MPPLPRLPTKSDFPPSLTLDIIPPTKGSPINILLLLHGLGDTQTPFTTLARNLNLPETACLSIQAPTPIPALFTGSETPSFHWADDVLFDEDKGEIDIDAGFKTAMVVLWESVIEEVLVKKCGYVPRNVLFYGFGQGGMAALQVVGMQKGVEFGGVVSVGGGMPSSISSSSTIDNGKSKTPVLVLGGSRSKEITKSKVEKLKETFSDFEYVKWAKLEDSMPRSREEMLPIMKLFARRLRSRVGVPEGAEEV